MVTDPLIRNMSGELASVVLATRLPPPIRAETLRTVFNVVHTTVGAAGHPIVDGVVRTHEPSTGGVPVLGRTERLDPHAAALAVGTAAHLDDYDDTHLATVIHPGAACLGAGLAIGLGRDVSGPELLHAVGLGVEVQLRLGLALTEAHYDAGWHITGTCGVVGAAVTAGLLAGLDEQLLTRAIDLAVSQTVGHREGFGSSVKPINAGKAAANGVLSVLLARTGFTAPATSLDGPRGFFAVLTSSAARAIVLDGFGTRWHLLDNTYKPYPCGIVCHPAIDAAIELHPVLAGRRVVAGELRCHPLVPELTGNPDPGTGLQARFSTVHGVATGLLDGAVGLPQYSDERATAPEVAALRRAITVAPDGACRRDEAMLTVTLEDGTTHRRHVEHARGSLARPMTDEELADKGRRLAEPVLGTRAAGLAAAVHALPDAPSLKPLLDAAAPARVTTPGLVGRGVGTRGFGGGDSRGVSAALCEFAYELRFADLPAGARSATATTTGSALCLMVGAARQPAVDAAVDALGVLSGPGSVPLLGRRERLPGMWAALAHGIAGHVEDSEDSEDTHPTMVVHPGAPVVAAALSAAARSGSTGVELLAAVAAGVEVTLRVGRALVPEARDRGWHLTGVAGPVGAAVAAGRLLGLDPARLRAAVGLAATQSAGLVEAFGTMAKSLPPGKAAAVGFEAAVLAEHGLDGPTAPIEGRRGLLALHVGRVDPVAMVDGLGVRWELARDETRPYACGVAGHAILDAAGVQRMALGLTEPVLGDRAADFVALAFDPTAASVAELLTAGTPAA
ncbi:MmgE/PrpD family protein [Actinophytocola sediminis]